MNEIVVVKDYTNEILEFKIISIWIVYTNMLRTLVSSTSTWNEPLDFA
jgi:hypothetical protein